MTVDRYLFRGFHKEENGKETIYIDGQPIKGKWYFGYLVKDTKYYITNDTQMFYEVIPETIGQYCGLEDKNGKKIFENDVVENTLVLDSNTLNTNVDIVEWNNEESCFMLGKRKRHFNNNLVLEVLRTKFNKEVK